MVGLHQTVGGIVVVAWIDVAIIAAIEAGRKSYQWTRPAAMVAGALLILQYLLGFGLLSSRASNSPSHYLFALLILIPVAVQQAAGKRIPEQNRGIVVIVSSLAAAFLAVIAYLTGTWGASPPAA
jgi:heme A synthase